MKDRRAGAPDRRTGRFLHPARVPVAFFTLLILFGGSIASAAQPAAVTLPGLTGFVRNTAGQILAGSVVLAVPVTGPAGATGYGPSSAAVPLATTTLEDGRYLFTGLAPGAWHITAVKAGYLAGTASVNTLLHRTLDLVLAPGRTVDPEIGSSSAWMLRVPPRDILRETEFAGDSGAGPAAPVETSERPRLAATRFASGRSFHLPVNGELQQWFSSEPPASGQAADAGGNATSLKLAMRVSERVDVAVAGEHERSDLQRDVAGELAGRVMGADRVGVTVGYDLDPVSRLDMRATYRRNSLLLEGLDAPDGAGTDGESITRTCATNWRTIVGETGRLDVSALYVDEVSREQADAGAFAFDPATSRLWRADGLYRAPVGSDHVISVGVRARMFETESGGNLVVSDGRLLSPLSDGSPLALAGPAPPGWAVHVHGGEEWTLNPALGLAFGFDYLRSLSTRESSHLVPQAGATWRPTAQTSVKAGVSWLADTTAGSADSHPSLPVRTMADSERLGYSLLVEQRAGENTVVAASASARPLSYEYEEAWASTPSVLEERPLYVSDGQAQSREAGVEVRRRFGPVTTRTGASWGRIDGLYAVDLPGEPLRDMHRGLLHYRVASVAASTRDGATEARLEYRTIDEQNQDANEPDLLQAATLSLRLSQALDFLRFGETRWRLMLAWQNSLDSRPPTEDDSGRKLLPRTEDRLSGGVSVRF